MKLFGEFLVEKGLVDHETIVKALVSQVAQLPTIVQIVFELKLLTSQQLFQCLREQAIHGGEFRANCWKLGFWTHEIERQVQATLIHRRTPLGKLLVDSNALNVSKLTQALNDYLSELNQPSAVTPKFGNLAESERKIIERADYGGKAEVIRRTMESLVLNGDGLEKLSDSLATSWRFFYSIGRLARAEVTETLARRNSQLIEHFSTFHPAADDIRRWNSLVTNSLAQLIEIRKFLQTEGSEKSWWEKNGRNCSLLQASLASFSKTVQKISVLKTESEAA